MLIDESWLTEDPFAAWLLLLGRLSLASVFLVSAIHKGIWYQKAVQEFKDDGVPWVAFSLPATIALHLVASLCIIVGYETRIAALLLAVFTILATLKVHPFWRLPKEEQLASSRVANANLGVFGGLLVLAVVGPGTLAWIS